MDKATMTAGKRGFVLAAALVAGACLAAATGGTAGAQGRPTGSLEMEIVVQGGKPLKSATIYAKNRSVEGKDTGPRVIRDVAAGRLAVTVDAVVDAGSGKGAARYLGVAESAVSAGATTKVTVTVVPFEDVDSFCLGCHPYTRDPKAKLLPGQIARDVHVSGQVLGERQLKQVRAYNDAIARLEKEGKPRNIPIALDERVVTIDGKQVKQSFYTCESCHTLHFETPNTKYARAPFLTKSDLCVGCHD